MKKNCETIINSFVKWCFFISIGILLPSCYEIERGCLDVNANNYDIDADEACTDDCCTFPSITLSISHKFTKSTGEANLIVQDSVYEDDFGNPYRFEAIKYWISDLTFSGDETINITDLIELDLVDGSSASIREDYALVDASSFASYGLGNISGGGNFTELSYKVGLTQLTNSVDFDALPSDNILADSTVYRSADEGYNFMEIELYRDTSSTSTPVSIEIGLDQNLTSIAHDIDFSLPKGSNISLTLKVDYALLMAGIDVVNDEIGQIESSIVNNIANAFFVIAVTAN
ncbi:MAG: MbnP family protein [Bacteroidota bacterium]